MSADCTCMLSLVLGDDGTVLCPAAVSISVSIIRGRGA